LDKVPEIEPDLAEWDYDDYEGKRSVDICKERPDWNVFQDGCPHGQFGSVLAARWIGLPLVEARHFPLGTASLSIFSFNPDHSDVPVIDLWNAASHNIFTKVSSSPTGYVDAEHSSF